MIILRWFGFWILSGGLACAPLCAQPGRAFRIEGLLCKGLTCELREGLQAGLTTVEAEGTYRGVDSVRLEVVRREPKEVVLDRKIGVMSNGKVTISIPAFRLAGGDYVFQISRANTQERLAVGSFRKTQGGAGQVGVESGGQSLIGEWRGINKTGGLVVISANGTYTFNGASGRYRATGNQIVFSGPLAAWNNGQATMKDGVIEFYWTNAQGWKQWFTFAKVK
jgi:hypothetical protein